MDKYYIYYTVFFNTGIKREYASHVYAWKDIELDDLLRLAKQEGKREAFKMKGMTVKKITLHEVKSTGAEEHYRLDNTMGFRSQ